MKRKPHQPGLFDQPAWEQEATRTLQADPPPVLCAASFPEPPREPHKARHRFGACGSASPPCQRCKGIEYPLSEKEQFEHGRRAWIACRIETLVKIRGMSYATATAVAEIDFEETLTEDGNERS